MTYFKSTATNQVYAANSFPQYGGYAFATRQEYEAYCKANHMTPVRE